MSTQLPTDHPTILQLEQLALRAWPAFEQYWLGDWCVRFAEGYSKRANSVTPLGDAGLALADAVRQCEQHYAQHQLPCIFRLVQGLGPAELDEHLAMRGYRYSDPVQVQHCDLAEAALPALNSQLLQRSVDLADWIKHYQRCTGKALSEQARHARILHSLGARAQLWLWYGEAEPIGCALAVEDGPYLGLFDLAIQPTQRGRGHGYAFMGQILAHARQHLYQSAYLQVLEDNHPALALYQRLGFSFCYRYHYRLAP